MPATSYATPGPLRTYAPTPLLTVICSGVGGWVLVPVGVSVAGCVGDTVGVAVTLRVGLGVGVIVGVGVGVGVLVNVWVTVGVGVQVACATSAGTSDRPVLPPQAVSSSPSPNPKTLN
jgi:hypothetical protein